MISWNTICQPKINCSLGFKNLDGMNKSLLIKVGWGSISSPSSLWTQVLTPKYGVNLSTLPTELPGRHGSHLWRSLKKVWTDILSGVAWNIGDGTKVRFWLDLWMLKEKPIISEAILPILDKIISGVVADFIDNNGSWRWDLFEHYLPHNFILRIASNVPPLAQRGHDCVYWASSKNGDFSVKSA